MDLLLPLVAVVLLAAFTQGVTGFGFGLLVMSVLPLLMDVREAVPLVSVLGLAVCATVLWRWRRHVDGRKVLPLLLGEVAGTPVGVAFLAAVDRRFVTGALGLVLVAYGAGRLWVERPGAGPVPPAPSRPLPSRLWGVVAGFFGGVIGGAFNTGGPPVILYATARRWDPGAFRANLQVVFLFNTVFQLVLFASKGLLTPHVLRLDAIALPALLVGVGAGTLASRRLDAPHFRRVVLVLLVAFGIAFLVRTVTG